MEPEIKYGVWHLIDGTHGLQAYPGDCFSWDEAVENYPGEPWTEDGESTTVIGFGARLSMPGFLDCTDWTVYCTEAEATAGLAYLAAEYPAA